MVSASFRVGEHVGKGIASYIHLGQYDHHVSIDDDQSYERVARTAALTMTVSIRVG